MTVSNILAAVNTLAPFSLALDWDNTGLLVGDANAPADKIGVCLDITAEQVTQAKALGISCIVSHHPVIFHLKEQKFLAPSVAYTLASAGISAIAAHTNLDSAVGGVNDVLASAIGLIGIEPIVVNQNESAVIRGGKLSEALSAKKFAQIIGERLNTCVRYANGGREIRRVAVCGGGAGEYIFDCAKLGFDAYLTGDVKHHEFLAAKAAGITLLAAGHFETEYPVVEAFAATLQKVLPNTDVIVLEEKNPVEIYS